MPPWDRKDGNPGYENIVRQGLEMICKREEVFFETVTACLGENSAHRQFRTWKRCIVNNMLRVETPLAYD